MTIMLSNPFSSPFTPLAWTAGGQPIYPAQGGRGGGGVQFAVGDDEGDDPEFDDERDDDEEDEDEDEPVARKSTAKRRGSADDEDADGDDPEWQPPTRESWERVQGALKRANSEAGKRRRVGRTMEKLGIDDLGTWLTSRGIDPESGEPFGTDVVGTADEADEFDGYEREPEPETRRRDERDDRTRDRQTARQILAAEQRGRAAERDSVMPILAEYAARTALRDAGFVGTPKQLEIALRSVDTASLDLEMDDDGFELIGIEEAIEELRENLPEYFERPAARRTARSATARTAATSRTRGGAREVDGGERGRQPKAALDWKAKMVQQMDRRTR